MVLAFPGAIPLTHFPSWLSPIFCLYNISLFA